MNPIGMGKLRKLLEVKVRFGGIDYTFNPLGIYILKTLENSDEGKNGYDILKEVKALSGGLWVPPKSTVYPMLKKYVEQGLLTVDEHGRYKLTEKGRTILRELEVQGALAELHERLKVTQKIIEKVTEMGSSNPQS